MTDFSWPAIFHGRDDTHFGSTLAEMVAEELKTGNKGLNPRARSVTTGPMGDAAIIGIGLSHASTPKSKKKPAGNKFILHEKFGSMNPRDTPPETTYKTKEEIGAQMQMIVTQKKSRSTKVAQRNFLLEQIVVLKDVLGISNAVL